jgi:hypothetical protein
MRGAIPLLPPPVCLHIGAGAAIPLLLSFLRRWPRKPIILAVSEEALALFRIKNNMHINHFLNFGQLYRGPLLL